METLRTLENLAEKAAPGRIPGYTPAHILYALVYLEKNLVGRKQLASELQIGEGTVRTLLGRLQGERLIEIKRQGISLRKDGVRFLAETQKVLQWADFPPSEITVGSFNFMVLIRGVAEKIRLGVEQRDQALIHGAHGATTLVYKENQWRIPGVKESLDDEITDYLNLFKPQENDAVIIGSSSEEFTAALGSFAAAFDLV